MDFNEIMDPSRLLLLIFVVMSAVECSETEKPNCTDIQERTRHQPDGEALHVMFVHQDLDEIPHERFRWYKKNSTNSIPISPNKTERVHYHAGELFFLNLLREDSGNYTAQLIMESGTCFNINVYIGVYNASDRENPSYFYGKQESSNDNININCPDPVVETCGKFNGNYTWYKDFNYLPGKNESELRVMKASQDDNGLYTCICTWPYNNNKYNSSASRMLEAQRLTQKSCDILSPINTVQFADEGVGIKLNCSVYCGFRAERRCGARWLPLDQGMSDRYKETTKVTTDKSTSKTIASAILTIDKVSAEDFQRTFKCTCSCYFERKVATLTLRQRENCTDIQERTRHQPDGEALHVMFVHQDLDEIPHEQFRWYKKNSTNSIDISPDKTERVHYHAGELFFLTLLPEDSGNYTAQLIQESGRCFNINVYIGVYNASDRENPSYFYGKQESSNENININCPDPVVETCGKFKGNYTWYKNFNYLPGKNESELWVNEASQDDNGLYTCICTWPYNNNKYNSSASRMLEVKDLRTLEWVNLTHNITGGLTQKHCEILSPINTEQFADEGVEIKLNCSVYCGFRAERRCGASWLPLDQGMSDRYKETTNVTIDNSINRTIATAILTIDKVSAEDFQRTFKCTSSCYCYWKIATLTLKQRGSRTPLIFASIRALLVCVCTAVLVKCFAIDLALLFRRYVPLSSQRKDERMYDPYVVYQTQSMDKVTEDKLSRFVTQMLPSVLEDKCGYRLFIHGRDDIPGEDRLELVEDSIKQSRRLMVILTPDSGSAPEVTDQCPASTQESAIGGFDWQVGLHHALVQREMSVILIQLGDTGPQGYTQLPIGLQHLIRKSAPLRWPDGSRGAASWNSRFWKRVRYLMPATPAKKCSQSAIV